MKFLSDVFANFFVRLIIGALLIFILNQFFVSEKIAVSVGINLLTLAVSGVFGVPGVCLLYGIVFYQGF